MIKFTAKLLLLTITISLMLPSAQLFAWNDTGHKIIAAIAWDNLTPTARENITRILKQAPEDSDLMDLFDKSLENPQKFYFMNASYWPDIVRDRDQEERWKKYHKGPWHYIGSYWKQTENGPVETEGPVEDENVVERIIHFKQTLQNVETPENKKAVQIAWVLHLIGDIHMPLHNASRVTDATPEGDRGGNDFRLGDEWPWNIHAYWDGIIDIAAPKNEETDDFEYYLEKARQIQQKHPKKEFKIQLQIKDPVKWSAEGKKIVMNEVYPDYLEQNQQPPEKYKEKAFRIAQGQMALSGYRMAEYLNNIFGN